MVPFWGHLRDVVIALVCRFSPGCIGVLLFQGDVGEGDTDNSGCRHLCGRELKLMTLNGGICSAMCFITTMILIKIEVQFTMSNENLLAFLKLKKKIKHA